MTLSTILYCQRKWFNSLEKQKLTHLKIKIPVLKYALELQLTREIWLSVKKRNVCQDSKTLFWAIIQLLGPILLLNHA